MKIRVEWTTPEDNFSKTFTTYQKALDFYTGIRDGDVFWSTIEMWRLDTDEPELLAVEEKSNHEIMKQMNQEEDLSLREEFSDDIEKFINDIYELRRESIANEGEYGLGNLVFKEFRNRGYLDYLKDLRKEEKGKELSLEGLEEELDTSKYNTLEALNILAKSVDDNGTYSIDKDGNLTKEELTSGYQVSFFRPEITNKDIKSVLSVINNKLGQAYLGRWDSPEISYCLTDKTLALKIAELFNQEAIWDNSKTKDENYKGDYNSNYDANAKVDYEKAVKDLKSLLN